jgi:hypothetical protein
VGKLIPPSGRERTEVKTWEALADGLLDAAITARLEANWAGRSEAERSQAWIDRHLGKVQDSLAAMSQGLGDKLYSCGTHLNLADLAVGCALCYLDFRFPNIALREDYANLAALQTVATLATPKLGSINLTGGSNLLGMTHLLRTQSGAALAKIAGNYSLALTGATVAQAIALNSDAKVASLTVTDSAANLSDNINDLHSLGRKLQSASLSVAGVPLGLTYTQWIGKASTLNKFTGGFTATVSGVAAAKAGRVVADNRVASVQVKDNYTNINNQLAALQGLGMQVSAIEQTNAGRLSMTESQWRAFTATLAKVGTSTSIQNSQATAELSVTQVPVSSLTALGNDSRVKAVGITDSAANVSASWNAINANTLVAAASSSISLLAGSSAPLKLTATQVGASTRLAVSDAEVQITLQDLGQEELFLLLGTEVHDGWPNSVDTQHRNRSTGAH